jgi:hypothetical protein
VRLEGKEQQANATHKLNSRAFVRQRAAQRTGPRFFVNSRAGAAHTGPPVMAYYAKMAEPTRALPAEYIGKVVARPLTCLPIVNAPAMRSATELALGNRGLEVLEGFQLFPNLECLWLQNNALTELTGLDTNVRLRRLYAANNRVSSLRGSLLAFKHLEELDLSDNAVSNLGVCLETLCVAGRTSVNDTSEDQDNRFVAGVTRDPGLVEYQVR